MHSGGGFDENSTKWKCCCAKCHVTTGTKVIGILAAISLGINGGRMVYEMLGRGSMEYAGGFVGIIIGIVVITCLFLALKKGNQNFLVPWLVLQVIWLFLLVICILLVILIVAGVLSTATLGTFGLQIDQNTYGNGTYYNSDDSQETFSEQSDGVGTVATVACVIMIIVILLTFALNIWFFLVVLRCYNYLKARRLAYGQVVQFGAAEQGQVAIANAPPPPYKS